MQQFLKQMTLSVLTFKVRNYGGKCFHAANQIWLSHFVRNEDSLISPLKQHPFCYLFPRMSHVCCGIVLPLFQVKEKKVPFQHRRLVIQLLRTFRIISIQMK